MPTTVFRGRYTDEDVIIEQLAAFFPNEKGSVTVIFERGRFFCTVPRQLLDVQRAAIEEAMEKDHYKRDFPNGDCEARS